MTKEVYMFRSVVFVLVVVSLLLGACAPAEYVLHPDDPWVVSQGGGVVSVPGTPTEFQLALASFVSGNTCQEYAGIELEAIADAFGLPSGAILNTCQDISQAGVMVAMIGMPAAALEPGILGEATVGAVMVGGQAVAWLFVKTAMIAGSAYLLSDLVAEYVANLNPIDWDKEKDPLVVPPEWELGDIPQEALEHLESPTHHAWSKHATAPCIAQIAKTLPRNQAFFSPDAVNPISRVRQGPSVLFVFYLDKALKDLEGMGKLGACADIKAMLLTEFGRAVLPKNVRIGVSFGFDPSQGYFTWSFYPISVAVFNIQLCDWNYTQEIFPQRRVVFCPGY